MNDFADFGKFANLATEVAGALDEMRQMVTGELAEMRSLMGSQVGNIERRCSALDEGLRALDGTISRRADLVDCIGGLLCQAHR